MNGLGQVRGVDGFESLLKELPARGVDAFEGTDAYRRDRDEEGSDPVSVWLTRKLSGWIVASTLISLFLG
ncbi:hypothetical protein ACLQ20_09160 [Micromonospora sp. DT46]|uniref:hypothetical protein n=1 Tax=Micromonospora sp. DT46 TaxID=3393435 RepID=UPI003CF991D7